MLYNSCYFILILGIERRNLFLHWKVLSRDVKNWKDNFSKDNKTRVLHTEDRKSSEEIVKKEEVEEYLFRFLFILRISVFPFHSLWIQAMFMIIPLHSSYILLLF